MTRLPAGQEFSRQSARPRSYCSSVNYYFKDIIIIVVGILLLFKSEPSDHDRQYLGHMPVILPPNPNLGVPMYSPLPR